MPEEPNPLHSLAELIPTAYYDLIARVCAGAPLLVLLLWGRRELSDYFPPKGGAGFLLLLGAGYLAGLLLTTFSTLWSMIFGLPVWVMLHQPIGEFLKGRTSRNDKIAEKNKEAGTTLAKMQAEATLCQNLLTAFLLLIIVKAEHNSWVPALDHLRGGYRCAALLILLATAVVRTGLYLGRQSTLYNDYFPDPKPTA
jgi:hypothetical protein